MTGIDVLDFDKLPNSLLAERLQADATVSRGYTNRAAVHLLTRANRGDLLWFDSVRECIAHVDGTLRVAWANLAAAYDARLVPASGADEVMLELALALAANRSLSNLGTSLWTLDPENKRIVLEAIAMAMDLPEARIGQEIRSTHPDGFRSGQWAKVLAVTTVTNRPCYVVMFPDRRTDLWVCDDPRDPYEFRIPA